MLAAHHFFFLNLNSSYLIIVIVEGYCIRQDSSGLGIGPDHNLLI